MLPFRQIRTELFSGMTVSLALVPEAIAFAFVAQVNPLSGLYAAFIVGLVTAALGGRPGMISGATGALAVVVTALVVQHGAEYLFATVVLMGLIQVLVGALNLGKFIRIVPYPVMLGFVNGLAIVIGLAQLSHFKTVDASGVLVWLSGPPLYVMLTLVAATMTIIHFLPKMTKAIPSTLASILIIFGLTMVFGIETKSVGDMASIAGGLPSFHIPMVPLNLETLYIIFPYALTMAAVGLIESLLALTLIDEITNTKGKNAQECMAQGAANIITGFFGGMGGCAMIGQSMINIMSGARHRIAGVVAACMLLVFIMFGAPIIEKIPVAALVGVMFMVVIGTFAWSSLRMMRKVPKADAFVVVLVSGLTVVFDLAIAVAAGVIVSTLAYAWKSSTHLSTRISQEGGSKVYSLYGSLFFGSASSFKELFCPKTDPDNIIVDFSHSRIWDHSALQVLEKLAESYKAAGKKVFYRGLSTNCVRILNKAGAINVDNDNCKDETSLHMIKPKVS